MSLTVPHSQTHRESSLVLGINILKINKHLIPTNPTEVTPLDKKMNWENNILK
jgi:hypothetical protein